MLLVFGVMFWKVMGLYPYKWSGSNRVKRGGSWNNNANNLQVGNRNNNNPNNENNNLGFRLVRSLRSLLGLDYLDEQG